MRREVFRVKAEYAYAFEEVKELAPWATRMSLDPKVPNVVTCWDEEWEAAHPPSPPTSWEDVAAKWKDTARTWDQVAKSWDGIFSWWHW